MTEHLNFKIETKKPDRLTLTFVSKSSFSSPAREDMNTQGQNVRLDI